MKICCLVLPVAMLLTLVPLLHVHAQGVDEVSQEYFRGFVLKNDAEKMESEGNLPGALQTYQQMQQIFDGVAQAHPTWQPGMIQNRRTLNQQAIARVQAKLLQPTASPVTTPAPAAAPAAIFPAPSAPTVPQPGLLAGQASGPAVTNGTLPSLSDFIRQYEEMYQRRFQELDMQNKQMQVDLGKWQQWYQWASGEITTARADKDSLAQKSSALEAAITAMKGEVAAGRAAASELDALTKEKLAIEVEYKKVAQRLAAAEAASKDASQKLVEASQRIATVEQERNKLIAERDAAIKERDIAITARDTVTKEKDTLAKERDSLSAQNLGMKTQLNDLKRTPTKETMPKDASEDMKRLFAENDRLRSELEAAQKQIVTLKADVSRKDQEIATLRGQLTTLQGEIATLRQQSGAYQTQVADLTRQLKELKDKPTEPMTPELAQENTLLREIIMRQLRSQYRQQQAKDLVIGELQKMEGVSKRLLEQVEELKNNRMTLSPEEEKIFTDPALREMLGSSGSIQGTLIASVSKPAATTTPAAAVGPVDTLLNKANEAFAAQKFSTAATLYEDALRGDPKNTNALVGLGYSRQREDKLDAAEAALKKCLAYDPTNDIAAFHLGVTHFKQQRWNDSMIAFEKGLAKNPQNARARHYLGIIATKLNFFDRAEREFKTALAIDPNYGEAHFNLAVLYATWDPPKWDKAKAEYDQALKKGVSADKALETLLKGNAPKSASAG